jgi:hypothetical protein
MITHIKATYIYKVFQYQACVYQTQAQYNRSHVLLTEMLQSEQAREILSAECILAVEKFQVTMKDKEQCIAYHVRKDVSLSRNAVSTSPVESMNSHIKGTMGCSSNQNTSNSLLSMARGSDQRISMYDTNSSIHIIFIKAKNQR